MENYDDQIKKMQQEMKELQTKYAAISGDVKELKNNQAGIQQNMSMVCNSVEKMSGNLEEMMSKLNVITGNHEKSLVEEMMGKKKGLFSKLVKRPIRKLAVGTLSTAMSVGDFAVERVANAKEGMEDLVAEAQYKKRIKRKMEDSMNPINAEA